MRLGLVEVVEHCPPTPAVPVLPRFFARHIWAWVGWVDRIIPRDKASDVSGDLSFILGSWINYKTD